MTAAVLTIPRLLGARDRARGLVRGSVRAGTSDVVVNAFAQESVAQGAADEIVKQLLEVGVEKVVVINATDHFAKHLRDSHWRRTSPGANTFLLQFQNRSEEVLLRSA